MNTRTMFGSGMDRATVFSTIATMNSRDTGLLQVAIPIATTITENTIARIVVSFCVRFFSVISSTTSRTAHTPFRAAPVTASACPQQVSR